MPDPYEVRQSGYGWAVFDRATRKKLSNQVSARRIAEDRCADMNAEARKTRRPCITCRAPFLSEEPHNRMCTSCRSNSDPLGWMSEVVS